MFYLYVKQHQKTGLKYFGQTQQDPYNYKGSGKYWLRHIGEHGRSEINTLNVWSFETIEECRKFAIEFSINNNIVESQDWANLMIENVDRNPSAYVFTEEAKQRIREGKQRAGYRHSAETIEKIRKASSGRKHKEEALRKMAEWKISNPLKHTDETKAKMRAAKLGTKQSAELVAKRFANRKSFKHSLETIEKIRQKKLERDRANLSNSY